MIQKIVLTVLVDNEYRLADTSIYSIIIVILLLPISFIILSISCVVTSSPRDLMMRRASTPETKPSLSASYRQKHSLKSEIKIAKTKTVYLSTNFWK